MVILGQVLPAALPGIMTGVILPISRAIGETAPLIIVGAMSYVAFLPENAMDMFTVLPVQIYNWAGRPQEAFHSIAAAINCKGLSASHHLRFSKGFSTH